MHNFISAEWYKLIRSRFFYVCTLISIVIAAMMTVSVKISGDSYHMLVRHVDNGQNTTSAVKGLLQLVEFSEQGNPAWSAAYGMNSAGVVLGAIFVILFMNMEYKKGTMLMLIGRGESRKKLILSKMMIALLGAEILFLASAVASCLTGVMIWGIPQGTFRMIPDMLVSIGCNMVLLAGCLSFAVVLAVLVQHSGETIGLYICISFVISNAMSIGVFGKAMAGRVFNILFLENMMSKMANILNMQEIPWIELGVSVGYMIVCAVLCCIVVEKKDLN